MNHWFVGQKVTCINDSFPPAIADWCATLPVAGCVYTIRALQIGQSGLGFLLMDVVNPKSSLGYEAGFLAWRFVSWLETNEETEREPATTTAAAR
jgi:hypothetical protein